MWRQHKAIQHAASVATTLAQEKQRTSDIRFRTVFNAAAVGIGVVDLTGHVQEVNAALARMLGYPPEEIIGESVAELVVPSADPVGWSRFGELLTGTRTSFRTEATFQRPDGETVVLDLSMSAVTDDGPRFVIGVAVDVTERRRLSDRLWRESRHDPLTGLPNRRPVLRAPAGDPQRQRRAALRAAADRPRRLQERQRQPGARLGDRVLVAVAERILARCRSRSAVVARLGGDEFAILSRDCTHGAGTWNTPRDVAAFDEPVREGRGVHALGRASARSATRSSARRSGEVMRAADLTLYRAKSTGRNRWVAYDRDKSASQLTRHTLATELPGAIKRGEFSVRYQPMVSLLTGAITGARRWCAGAIPARMLHPGQFLPLAMESGLIVELSRWVLDAACDQLKAWHESGPPELCMRVNLAPVHLQRPRLAERILEALHVRDLPPDCCSWSWPRPR